MMAKWARTRVIAVDTKPDKFDACRKAGADEVVDASPGRVAEQLLELTNGQGVDVVIDYVSATATLEAGAKALGRHGRLVTLGGSGKPFQASAVDMLYKEQDLLGSRYVTRSEVVESLDLVARGEVFPLVTRGAPAGGGRGRARTGRARRGDRPRRVADCLNGLLLTCAEDTRTSRISETREFQHS